MEKAHQICLEMMDQRQYEIILNEPNQIIALKPDKTRVVVFLSNISKFNVQEMQTYISGMNKLKIFHAIIIYQEGVTSFTKKIAEESIEMKFELFAMEDHQYIITKHKYQPQFKKLDPPQELAFKEKYGNQFAVLRKNDPITLFYGYEKGNVIKIIRKNGYITFRIVK